MAAGQDPRDYRDSAGDVGNEIRPGRAAMPVVPIALTPAMRRAGSGKMAETVTPLSIALPVLMIVMLAAFHLVMVFIFQVEQTELLLVLLVEVLALAYPLSQLASVWTTWRSYSRGTVFHLDAEVTETKKVGGGDDTVDFLVVLGNESPPLEFEVPARIDLDEFFTGERYQFLYRPGFTVLFIFRHRPWLLAATNSNGRLVYHDKRYDPAKDADRTD